MTLKIYGDSRSGNCLKIKWTARHLQRSYSWIEVDILNGGSRTPEFLALNPAGQTPVVVLDDGRPLAQSNAVILHLAERSPLIPADGYARAKMMEWLFWEQYSHEPAIAVARFRRKLLGLPAESVEPDQMRKGRAALARLELQLNTTPFLVGEALSLADIALVAYTRWAHEGGFDLDAYPAVKAWVARTERVLDITD